jgi:cell division protein FtsB
VDVCGFLKNIGEGNIDVSEVKNLDTLLPLLAESQSNYRGTVMSFLDMEAVKKLVDQVLEGCQLSEREKTIFTMFYGIDRPIMSVSPEKQKRERQLQEKLYGRSLEEIGDEFGLTCKRVRQLLKRTEKRLFDCSLNGVNLRDSIVDILIYERKIARLNEEIISLKDEIECLETHYQGEIALLKRKREVESPHREALSFLTMSIKHLTDTESVSVRLRNLLLATEFRYLYELANHRDLLKCRSFGKKSLNELDILFDKVGLDRTKVPEDLIKVAKSLVQKQLEI